MATLHQEQRSYRVLTTRHDIERTSALTLVTCTGIAAIAAAGAAIVAIVGLANDTMRTLTAVAALVASCALVLHGTGAAGRARRRYHHAGDRTQVIALWGSLALEILGGAAGVVLAITALAGVWPYGLLPVAAIVAGSAAVLAAPGQYTLAWLAHRPLSRLHRATYGATAVGAWALVAAGTASYVLGTLALIGLGDELVLSCAAMLCLGIALTVAATALMLRFVVQIGEYRQRPIETYSDRLLDLFAARLSAARTGYRLYDAALLKLRAAPDPLFDMVIPQLEAAASKELENVEYLEAQIEGFGGEPDIISVSADIEERTSRGFEEVVRSEDVVAPLHVLYALHAADMADAAGWKLLMEVVDEIGHHELKKEVTVRHGDKNEQVHFLERIIERLVRHAYVGEPLEAPAAAYN